MSASFQDIINFLNAQQYKAAFKSAKSAIAQNKSDPTFPNLAGIALSAGGQHRDALNYFKRALKLAPSYHDARKNLAQTLTVLNRTDLAQTQLNMLLKQTPQDSEIWFMLAQVHMSTNQLNEALKAAHQMIALDARQARYFNLRALLHDRLGHSAEAITDFETALAINPNDVETLINISLPLARQNRHAEAMEAIKHAVSLAPHHVGAQLRLAAQYVETGDTASAIKAYETVLDLAPGTPEAYENLSILLPPDEAVHLTKGLARAFEKTKPKTIGRAQLSYASARLAEKASDPSGMANWLVRANREMARIMPFNG